MMMQRLLPTNISIGDTVTPPYFYGAFENKNDIPSLQYPRGFDSPFWSISAIINFLGYRQKIIKFDNHLQYFYIILIDMIKKRGKLKILDIGGGVGDNYIHIKNIIPEDIFSNIQYTILDTEATIIVAKQLHNSLDIHDIHLISDIREIVNNGEIYDIALLSGVLMYIDDIYSLIDNIINLLKTDVFITRALFCQQCNTFTSVHYTNIPYGTQKNKFIGVEYPTIYNLSQFKNIILSKNYINFFYMYENYSKQLLNLPDNYRNVHYAQLFITKEQHSKYSKDWWYNRTGIEKLENLT
jgi:putative methyltransferase (TIGR04325 family)